MNKIQQAKTDIMTNYVTTMRAVEVLIPQINSQTNKLMQKLDSISNNLNMLQKEYDDIVLRPNILNLKNAVKELTGHDLVYIMKSKRDAETVAWRHPIRYYLYTHYHITLLEVGVITSCHDTSVRYSIQVMRDLINIIDINRGASFIEVDNYNSLIAEMAKFDA